VTPVPPPYNRPRVAPYKPPLGPSEGGTLYPPLGPSEGGTQVSEPLGVREVRRLLRGARAREAQACAHCWRGVGLEPPHVD